MGAYIPPADTTGVDDLRAAWASCSANCKPLLLGDLNFDLRNPRSKRKEMIVDFVNDINVADMSCKFWQWMGCRQGPGARWTWRQWRGGRWYHSQPDYCLAWEGDVKLLQNIAFQQPRVLDSDHRAVVLSVLRGHKDWVKKFRRQCQTFPLTLPPWEDQDKLTRDFGDLKDTCNKEVRARRKYADWISPGTWHLINH